MQQHQPIITPRALLRAITRSVADELAVEIALVEGHSRVRDAVNARKLVARRLHARGLSELRIAAMMRIHVSTVRQYVGKHR